MQICERKEIVVERDMDLIRELLFRIERDPRFNGTSWLKFDRSDLEGMSDHSTEEIAYHLRLVAQAGFVEADFSIWPTSMPSISALTWDGHEFLDNVRDPDIWRKTKERLVGLTGVGLSVIGEVAKAEIKKHLGLP